MDGFLGVGIFLAMIYFCILVTIVVGYIKNIIRLVKSKEFDFMSCLRILGIFVPVLGIILGYV